MQRASFHLFGRFHSLVDGKEPPGLEARKVQELLCYLLMHRDKPQNRELLATSLFGDRTTVQSKKNLRHLIWQLQNALAGAGDLLVVDNEWLSINPQADLWLDVADFEQAYAAVQTTPGALWSEEQAHAVTCALSLYQGDLLQGWYTDWCLFERERLLTIYLTLLDRLASYWEARHAHEPAIFYAQQMLRHDRARESTHRRLMRLYYAAGDRTAALRQYEACVAALAEELDVAPARRTRELYAQICADRMDAGQGEGGRSPLPSSLIGPTALQNAASPQELADVRLALVALQSQLAACLAAVEHALNNHS